MIMSQESPDPSQAKDYASIVHGHQQYNAEVPYVRHLEAVVAVLARFGFTDQVMICAALLHDSIEDTDTSYSDIKSRFGTAVAELVYSVTSELGRNRKERNLKTYGKMKGRFLPTALKLADRIANVEYGSATGGKTDMYRSEYPGFYMGLFHDPEFEGPWQISTGTDISPALDDNRVSRMWTYLNLLLGDPLAPAAV